MGREGRKGRGTQGREGEGRGGEGKGREGRAPPIFYCTSQFQFSRNMPGPITVVFDSWHRYTIPSETPSAGHKIYGMEKFASFDRNRHLSRKRHEIGPWLLWNVNRKS